jgi:hypothetical protein
MMQQLSLSAVMALLVGCVAQTPVDPTTSVMTGEQSDQGPGSEAWAKEDISCDVNNDCLTGESCLNDVCQPTQCEGGLVESNAPIGASFTFFADNEIGVADSTLYSGSYWVDTFAPSATSAAFASSTEMASSRLIDLSGGRFEKVQDARYVAAIEGRNAIGFSSSTGTEWTSLTFQPLAIDAGDTDADGLDEVVAVSEDGVITACHIDSSTCDYWQFEEYEDMTLLDVAVGDVDGDAVAEIAMIIDHGGERLLYVLNQDWEEKGQLASYQWFLDEATRIDIGDLDGDRTAEIIVLKDVNQIPLWGEVDGIDVFTIAESITDQDIGELSWIAGVETGELQEIQDIDVADTSADSQAEIYAIDISGKLISFDMESGTLYERFTKTLDGTGAPHRIALTDADGDSPQASLVDGPTLARGAPVPATLVMMPPYDADHSSGPSSSAYGSSESTSSGYHDTVSLSMNVDLGVGVDFMEMFGASFSTSVQWRVNQMKGEQFRLSVGERFGMSADPEMYGPYHGAVALYWGCFDTYTYEISDPNSLVSDMDSETFILTVPVGGATSIWSLSRYNALAEAVGDLPVIDIPYAVGTVEDYPEAPEKLDGTEIPEEDMVLTEVKWYLAPDVGSVSYRASLAQEEYLRESWTTSMGASASVTVAGVKVGMGTDYGWGQGYSLGVGSSAFFSGSVKAVPDNPNTPEDEYEMYAFRFAPVVYRQWYETPSGDASALYVMTYAAKR